MFTAALFTIAKTWKQEDVVQIHDGILLSHEKEQNNAICSNVDGTIETYTKRSQKETDKYHMISLISGI